MKLYLVTQSETDGYDTYDSCVVSAPDPISARWIHPHDGSIYPNGEWAKKTISPYWCIHPGGAEVVYIGDTYIDEVRVILASFSGV